MIKNENKSTPLKILFVAAEAEPFIKVGGLGDVAGALPKALRELSSDNNDIPPLDIRLVIPFHPGIDRQNHPLKYRGTFSVPHPVAPVPATVYESKVDNLPVYFIGGPPIPEDGPVYTVDVGVDAQKFVFFSLACLEMTRHLGWAPDILHANDWHTAISVYQLDHLRRTDPFFANTKSILSVHNLPFMGAGAEEALQAYGIPPATSVDLPDWARYFPLPMGFLTADRIIAVSPGYANELFTPEFGCGLQEFLKTKETIVSGILNGIDVKLWDPARDPALKMPFDKAHLEEREINKLFLQSEFDLETSPDIPLLVFVGRMDPQKGIDLILDGLRLISHLSYQVIILGTGDKSLETAVRKLEKDFPDRVRAAIRFDANLARQIYAGADGLLMPSRYEPCGLAQMYAMRYGCVPIARGTGGLLDTIIDYRTRKDASTGFLFDEASAPTFAKTIMEAIKVYQNEKKEWSSIQIRGMEQDFSWEKSARQYVNAYNQLRESVI